MPGCRCNTLKTRKKGFTLQCLATVMAAALYFRSHIGADLVTAITMEALKSFIKNIDVPLLNDPFTSFPSRTTIANRDLDIKAPRADQALRQLFASIIAQWNDAIYKNWNDNKPGIKEMEDAKVDDTYIKRFSGR
jgi:hypothetical protein